jgi:hypothetical protein
MLLLLPLSLLSSTDALQHPHSVAGARAGTNGLRALRQRISAICISSSSSSSLKRAGPGCASLPDPLRGSAGAGSLSGERRPLPVQVAGGVLRHSALNVTFKCRWQALATAQQPTACEVWRAAVFSRGQG